MDDAAVMPARHKLDVHDYERMVLVGILGEQDRVELIRGEILDMAPIPRSSLQRQPRLRILAFPPMTAPDASSKTPDC